MLWMYAVSALCLLICLPFFMHYKQALRYKLAAAYKSLGTLCAASFSLIAAIRLDPHCWICFAALLLHAVADYLLEFSLYLGAGIFLAGHICYICFFTRLFPVSSLHLIAALVLIGIIFFLLWRWRKPIGKRMPLFAVYGGILAITCACAIAGLSSHTLQGQMIAAAGALFFISDAILLAKLLFSASRSVDWAIMITYYGDTSDHSGLLSSIQIRRIP